MDSLLERIEENRLDALYLFINETLRDRQTFDHFLQNLVSVLPHNWSIQRVEVGHEFLSMVTPDGGQDDLFELICGLESLRTLIISDGYVPRKDNGSVQTEALLSCLPRARNLINLDLQRLQLQTTAQVDMLEDVFESMSESLEEIRITGLVVEARRPSSSLETAPAVEEATSGGSPSFSTNRGGILDGPIRQCIEMGNLRSLAISQNIQAESNILVSHECLLELCQNATTLQDLALRNMDIDDATCNTMAQALHTNSFLTSLDLRQNDRITHEGYSAILHSLERNYDLWCTVMVDNDSFQAKFNSLIELNQANRGDLVRSPTRDKLATFLQQLGKGSHGGDPTSLWYFLTIHDSILYPFVEFIQWKGRIEDRKTERKRPATNFTAASSTFAVTATSTTPVTTNPSTSTSICKETTWTKRARVL